ncbi:hypothetical protein Ae201684P_021215 [Aphanomyces euteiches]|uniref:DNA-directed DNA polymerase n=1 Tax=Aphanomyces euteiches TaxID=100861 RepID=A0A6G0X7D1_9STRA|nr:hypothetical protein Ae201684_007904 [Aphanomyces euteiches]KAH9067043.1 hypothetical protein Ae201684P_021215 [Aphanomyces euteiches]
MSSKTNNAIKANKAKSVIYQQAKSLGLPVWWQMHASRIQDILNNHQRQVAAQTKIASMFKSSKAKSQLNDLKALKRINKFQTTTILLDSFKRIRPNIVAPEDKNVLVHFLDEDGSTLRTYHLNSHQVSIDELYISQENEYTSGADVDLNILPTTMVRLEWIDDPKQSRSARKNFFRYLTKADYILDQFQVYPESPNGLPKSSEIPCFLYALEQAGVSKTTVNKIKQIMFHSGIMTNLLKKVAEKFKLRIDVKPYKLNKSGAKSYNTNSYGPHSKDVIHLGLTPKHIFAIKPTRITTFALNHPDLVKREGSTEFALRNGLITYNSTRLKFLDSFEVISHLYHNRDKLLIPITQSNVPRLLNNEYQKVDSLSEEDFSHDSFKEIGRVDDKMRFGQSPFDKILNKRTKEHEEIADYNVIYFDIKTLVEDGEHVAYCISFKMLEYRSKELISTGSTQHFYGFDCAQRFLEAISENSHNLLWAHTAGFDLRFLMKHVSSFSQKSNIIECGTRLKQAHCFYKSSELVIKCTMSFINSKLANLPKMFKDASKGLSLEKESFPHDLINASNFKSMWKLSYLDGFEDKDAMIANATKIGAVIEDQIDIQKYAIHYCNRDVDVLHHCFEAFRSMFIDRFNIDVYRFMSMPSIAYAIQHNQGCFDGCFEQNGVALGFIRQVIVGGRVMTRDNEKHHVKHQLSDFDAVSLYQSGQSILPGYVQGKAKFFKNYIPEEADYYIARVRFDSIGKRRHFPLLSIQQDGSRNFTNDIVGQTMVLGKQAPEDIAEFQGVQYTVIEGCYWSDGFNSKIVDTVKELFDERLKLKKQGNPLQEGIKLLLNSAYGKLIQKPIVKEKLLVKGSDKIAEHTRKQIHKLISLTPITDDLALFEEHKYLYEHYSPAHLGVQILDASKHIMNEVMCLAEDIDAHIWYQDTDSMHIDRDAISRLAEAFRAKYGRELIGNQMGQFHTDFDLNGICFVLSFESVVVAF